jgi:hypothetical protein
MRWSEIMETASAGASTAGGMAAVIQPLGSVLSRTSIAERDKYKIMKTKTARKRPNVGR